MEVIKDKMHRVDNKIDEVNDKVTQLNAILEESIIVHLLEICFNKMQYTITRYTKSSTSTNYYA